jgi:ABC-type transporter Mla MlaB component
VQGAQDTAGALLRPALRQHDHACWSYDNDGERSEVLGTYFRDGLAARERLYYFETEGSHASALVGLDVTALVKSGALVIGDVAEAYFPGGAFDAEANIEGFRALAHQAVADGYLGIRVAAENAAVLNHPLIRESWFDYELMVDGLVSKEPIVGLCAFDRRQCDDEELALLDAVHLLQHDPDGSAPHSTFHVHTSDGDVLVLTGEVDGFHVGSLKRLLEAPVRRRDRLRLDLRGLSFLDPAGMQGLEDLAAARTPSQGPLELQGVTPFQHKVWQLTGHPDSLALVAEGL